MIFILLLKFNIFDFINKRQTNDDLELLKVKVYILGQEQDILI